MYLDRQFPTLASVNANLETESQQIKADQAALAESQQKSKAENEAIARAATAKLQAALKQAANSPAEAQAALDKAPQIKDELQPQMDELQDLLEFRTVLGLVGDAQSLQAELTALETPAAAQLYHRKAPVLLAKLQAASEAKESRASLLAAELQRQFSADVSKPRLAAALDDLNTVLRGSQWPQKEPTSPEFVAALATALRFEAPTQPVLETFVELAAALDERVKFNFESDRETARPDKPEWLLAYFFKIVDPHIQWLARCVQPVLAEVFPTREALNELCSALLPSFYRALGHDFDQIVDSPDLVSHLMQETLHFDRDLHDRYFYQPATLQGKWPGLSGTLLAHNDEYLRLYLEAEKTVAFSQFQDALAPPSAWNIDTDAVSAETTRPTVSALILKQLFDATTQTILGLCSPDLRRRFVDGIQLELVDGYTQRLTELLQIYTSLHSPIGRAVGSVSAEDRKRLSGTAGVEYLAKIFCAADFCLQFLTAASNELVYVELSPERGPDLFAAPLDALENIKALAAQELAILVLKELQPLLKPYLRMDWHGGPPGSDGDSAVSSPLVPAGTRLAKFAAYLRSVTGPADAALILRGIATSTADYLYNNVVKGSTFTRGGGAQFLADTNWLWQESALPKPPVAQRLFRAASYLADPSEQGLSEQELETLRRRAV